MDNTQTVAALFVDPSGIYSTRGNVDCWGVDRDARKYAGPHPVVAHPPCQLWGRFAKINYIRWGGEHNKPGNDKGCFNAALLSVERFGGVLEHPADSYAWPEYGLLRPIHGLWTAFKRVDRWGYVCEVWQSAYGHPARKRTWLYYCGPTPTELRWSRTPGTHQIGFHDQRGKANNKPTISGKAASASPPAFADELISLARRVR